jgi:membrane protein
VVIELQNDLNRIWRVPKRDRSGYPALIRARLLAFGMILGFGFLLLVSLIVNVGSGRDGAAFEDVRAAGPAAARIESAGSRSRPIRLLFAMLFKWLPNVRLGWRDVWRGALVTAVLFSLGQLGIGYYLGRSATTSAYAAAASLLVLLLWLYYAAQIFLFGAEVTWVYAHGTARRRPNAGWPRDRRGIQPRFMRSAYDGSRGDGLHACRFSTEYQRLV